MDQIPQQMNPKPSNESDRSSLNNEQIQTKEPRHSQNERRIALSNFVSGDIQELDEKVKSMMEVSQNFIPNGRERAKICKMCGKEGQAKTIRDHIEANHLEGVSLPCNTCKKSFRTRHSLRDHNS